VSPDGKVLASASYDDTLRFWDVAAGRQIGFVRHPDRDVLSVAFSPDGRTLACGVEKDVLIYDLEPPPECLEWWLREASARSQETREEPTTSPLSRLPRAERRWRLGRTGNVAARE
jgi:WD40 repeat protein